MSLYVVVTGSAPSASHRGVLVDAAIEFLDLIESGSLGSVDQVFDAYLDLMADSQPIPVATALVVLTMDDTIDGMDKVAEAMRPARGFATDAFDRLNRVGRKQ